MDKDDSKTNVYRITMWVCIGAMVFTNILLIVAVWQSGWNDLPLEVLIAIVAIWAGSMAAFPAIVMAILNNQSSEKIAESFADAIKAVNGVVNNGIPQ